MMLQESKESHGFNRGSMSTVPIVSLFTQSFFIPQG